MKKHTYTVYDPFGNALENVSILAQDDEDAQNQIDQYLNRKVGCYAFESDEDEHDSE